MELVTVIRFNRISTEKHVDGNGKNTTCTQICCSGNKRMYLWDLATDGGKGI
jgi:hypothetical protein